jgi:hypothetical protein
MMTLFELDKKWLLNIKRLLIVGDLHGDYFTLKDILYFFNPIQDGIIFLGDYADRGEYGIEVIDTIRYLLMKYPNRIVALKGNHEDYTSQGYPTFSPYDLIGEVKIKRGSWSRYFSNCLKPFFEKLFLTALIPGEILFVHGGISSKIKDINDLKKPSIDVEKDILWSDPFDGYGEYPNRRGIGVEFGVDITIKISKKLNVKKIIRSHEPRKAVNGPYYEHEGKVITVNSTRVYGIKPFFLIIKTSDFEIDYRIP